MNEKTEGAVVSPSPLNPVFKKPGAAGAMIYRVLVPAGKKKSCELIGADDSGS